MPSGIQPRAAFGYSSSLLLLALVKLNLINNSYKDYLKKTIISLKKISKELTDVNKKNSAIDLAYQIHNKFPIVYSTPLTEIVSLRFRGQLAENAKILSLNNVLPEQNHNEIEAFRTENRKNIIIWIQDENDNKNITKRIKMTSKILTNIPIQIFHVQSGDSYLEKIYKSIYFFDWVSFYSAILNKTDPTPVKNILKLKKLMTK